MPRSSQNCNILTFSDNLRTVTHERNMETRQMIPFFSSTFSTLTVTFLKLKILKKKKNSFFCGPHFGPFWSIKYVYEQCNHTFLYLVELYLFSEMCGWLSKNSKKRIPIWLSKLYFLLRTKFMFNSLCFIYIITSPWTLSNHQLDINNMSHVQEELKLFGQFCMS